MGSYTGPYCTKVQNQSDPNHRVRPRSLPDHISNHRPSRLSPRRSSILAQHPHERIRVACLTGARRHRLRVPCARQYRHPRPGHTRGFREWKNKFKSRTANGRSNRITQSDRQLRQWRHSGRKYWMEWQQIRLCWVGRKITHKPGQHAGPRGHIRKLEEMHEVLEGELNAIAQTMVLFSHTNELKIPELANSEINPPENHQDNGATPLVNTQPSPPQSPPENTLVDSAKSSPSQHIKARYASLQEREGDLSDVLLLGADYMLYGAYQYWLHQNSGDHLDGGIAEDSKWQAWWKIYIFLCRPNATMHLPGKLGRDFCESCLYNLMGFVQGIGT